MEKILIPIIVVVLGFGVYVAVQSHQERTRAMDALAAYHYKAVCSGAINGFVWRGIYFTDSTSTDDGCAEAEKEAAQQQKDIAAETKRYCAYMRGKPMSYSDYQRCI